MNTAQDITIIRVSEDEEFEAVFGIRRRVFIEEQQVPEEDEVDGHDPIAHHYLVVVDGQAVGTARWRITPGRKVKLERFAILPEYRGKGFGEMLVRRVLKDLPRVGYEVYLHAQLQAVNLYARCGFVPEGEIFDECGILHRTMVLPENPGT